MEDIRRFKEGGQATISFVSKFIVWLPLIALIIYIIYLITGIMSSKGLTFAGASLFAMPWAFGQSGLLSGSLSLIFLAFLTYYTLYWLGKCSHLVWYT